jgi:hypothetical protein
MRFVSWFMGLTAVALAVAFFALGASEPAVAAGAQTLEYSTTSEPAEFTPVSGHYRVCCKRGRHDWRTSRRACWNSGGRVVAARHCRNDSVRICCKRGRYDWWTTPRACSRSGGYRVAGWHCRNG